MSIKRTLLTHGYRANVIPRLGEDIYDIYRVATGMLVASMNESTVLDWLAEETNK